MAGLVIIFLMVHLFLYQATDGQQIIQTGIFVSSSPLIDQNIASSLHMAMIVANYTY